MKKVLLSLSVFATILLFALKNDLAGHNKSNAIGEAVLSKSCLNRFQAGDIVLRSGKGFISSVFREFSTKEKRYSHAGIINIENGKIYVYHMFGSSNQMQMRRTLLEDFCSSKENKEFAVYRYDLLPEQKQKLIIQLKMLFNSKIKFDEHFDLATDSALYCTELIFKLANEASHKKNYLLCTQVNGKKYIAPDDLYLNPHAELIFSKAF